MLRSISQRSLHRTTFVLHDERFRKTSLFPLFDDRGAIRRLMLTTGDSAKIALISPDGAELALPRLGAKRLDRTWSGLLDVDREAAEEVGSLWHFDPWWALEDPRFHGHPAVPVLKSTNLAGAKPAVEGLWFRRDLSRVSWYQTKKNGEPVLQRFEPTLMEGLERRRPARSARAVIGSREWVLRPFWERV